MKRFCIYITLILILPLIGKGQSFIRLSNPAGIARVNELVAISWHKIQRIMPAIDKMGFVVMDPASNEEVKYQLEYLGSENIQHLLLQVNLKPHGTTVLEIRQGTPSTVEPKTFCRYVPEREDDFAWENDKIAFRMYGKALESNIGNAKGMDVWTKRTDKLVIDNWYKKGNYHVDHGEGVDYYDVGMTLGAGDNAPFLNDSIWFPKNYTRYRILDDGPLRCTFELKYDGWKVGDRMVGLVKTISLDAGAQLNRVNAHYSFAGNGTLDVVVGIVKRGEAGIEHFDETRGIMRYWQPNDSINGTTGVGCIFVGPVRKTNTGKHQLNQLLGLVSAKSGVGLNYYSGAVWDKAGVITTVDDWDLYLRAFSARMKQPIDVRLYRAK
ncbi:MAG TPA: DUF4861 family protein [Arachidicoccus sp.]|nr:DUF4861 family protein [Arachidicoccus sp.]